MSRKVASGSEVGGQKVGPLDGVDMRILSELRDDGRISMAVLAERVNISRAGVYTRVQSLISTGVISGFSARVDPEKVGLGICALVFVTVHPQAWEPFRDKITDMPDIESCRITTGEHDAMLVVRASEVGEIHNFVIGVVAALAEVKSVETVLVLDEVFERPFLLPIDLPSRETQGKQLGLTRYTRAREGRGS
ncbi:Lrp/AsnC family transcriptional regulator [Paeniglutamicibacter gangotriensis]|uniref:Lrp/AsnC family transcriptional regulator n=1 Tax=Paeniglutamicibacter gangotriensis Lz1y TaxID=1276920 RepID=M7NE61_9MICC|nr:Lrp/AsnC family transcriptional regulator [Paeniglutamicibacter gangotriensis]EMQ96758.1 Lrp/AsnC family transcriptional regulator [Paeniglutamicibacter gangotriensis Lz1y]